MSGLKGSVLAIAPVSRGLGVVVIDKVGKLLDWRVKEVRKERHKNNVCQAIAEELFEQFQPSLLVIEDHRADGARRGHRIGTLLDLIAESAAEYGIRVSRIGMRALRATLGLNVIANKHAIAAEVAKRLPPLAPILPKRRRVFDPEPHNMAIFTAAALALAHH